MTRACVVLVAALAACSAAEPGAGIDVDRALAHARALVELGPRPGETAAAKRAAEYIASQLPRARRMEVGVVEIPAITVLGTTYRHAHRTETTDPNVVARYGPEAGKAILVMAHYDTVRGSPGAIDNAAAVGVAIELARVLEAEPPRAPVIVALTAREEAGLIGAEALAAQIGDGVDFAIALDLIGGDGELALNGAGKAIGAAEMQWLAAAADRAGVVLRAPLAHRVISRWWPQAERSDHGAFTRRGIRAVHFYHRGHDGELIDRAYHSPLDTFERIERAAVDEIGRLLRAIVASPPPPPGGDAFWVPVLANTVIPRAALLGFELALAALAIAMLVRMRAERERGGAGLAIGAVLLALGLGAVFAIERGASPHPAPAIHAPAYHAIAEALVLVGVVGLASRLVARFAAWRGSRRYLAVSVGLLLVIGLGLLAIGAAELAWIWLVPAACASSAPFVPERVRLLALAPTLLPAVLVLDPAQLREAAWNGFAPPQAGLVGWLAVVSIAPLLAGVYWLRDRSGSAHSGPLGTLVLAVGWALAIVVGTVMLLRFDSPCTAAQFHEFFLRCEIIHGV